MYRVNLINIDFSEVIQMDKMIDDLANLPSSEPR